ncbi:sporulation protein YqfC [Clostridium sediminicola]|uniref:sporulation protein YqfC n=1 Tax=Clostridium sediminicola TaxID=3114879 RepID=UPI0031F2553D
MQHKVNKTREVFAERLDLPKDIVMNLPKISVIGDKEITIENHKGIVVFDENEIKVNSSIGLILIKGRELEILFMENKTLTLKGKFCSIIYEENNYE